MISLKSWITIASQFVIASAFMSFTPKVEWRCLSSSASVRLLNNSPFFGVIHPTGHRTHDCTFVGTGGSVLEFEVDFDKCNVHYDKQSRKRKLRLELHQHQTLVMERDQTVDIECLDEEPRSTVKLLENEELGSEASGENMTDSMEHLLDLQTPVDFDLELSAAGASTSIANYGQPYNLKVTINEPSNRRFRVHSCYARSHTANVELISPNGCSLDKNLMENFVYGNRSAEARIESMFRFAESQSVKFECSLRLCAENEECKPNCLLKLDYPVGEDPELVSKLLRSSLSDSDDISSSGHSSLPLSSRKPMASTIVHVVERREPTPLSIAPTESVEPSKTDRVTVNITGCKCDVPKDLVLFYKLCICLSLLFALGCCGNVMLCCLNVRGKNATKKRRSVPKTIAQSTLTRNQYWINEPVTQRNGPTFEEFPSQYTEMQPVTADNAQLKHNSVASYASLRPRPKTNAEHSVSLIGYHPNGQVNNKDSGFHYDTNATSIMSALSNYNNNRNSPPRSSGYEVPNNRTFHSASNSISMASPRNSSENGGINPASQALITSTSSATAALPPNDSPSQFLTMSATEAPRETYSIL